ncbi:MAG: hypothetical protein HGA87_00310 [Desulfobulbaceae bacterium]|nr:hypothetical protein [Desulfobulbaceae bacterium]
MNISITENAVFAALRTYLITVYAAEISSGYIDGETLTVTSHATGSWAVGKKVYGNGILNGTVITEMAQGTTGGVGEYTVSLDQEVGTALAPILLYCGPEIVRGLDNRVPMPADDFIVMTAINSPALGRPVTGYYDPAGHPELSTINAMQPTNKVVQIDFYGEQAGDRAATLSAILAQEWSCMLFPQGIKPLQAKDPKRIDFSGEDNQNIIRWEIDIEIQYNPIFSTSQQFADEASVAEIINVNTFEL